MERSTSFPICIGIDVSKDSLDVADSKGDSTFRFENQARGWSRLLTHIRKVGPSLVVVEASGGYQEGTVRYLYKKNLCPIAVLNPKKVRDFARAQGILAKTDRLDAKVLVRFGQVMNPRPWQPREAEVEELEPLVKRREQLVEMLAVEKARLSMVLTKVSKRSIENHITYLEEQIKAFQKEIQVKLSSGELKQKADLLQSMSGVGPTTASVLLTRLPELDSGKQSHWRRSLDWRPTVGIVVV